MNVVNDTSIVGQIKQAIMSNEAAGTAIKQIEVTEAEMKAFLGDDGIAPDMTKRVGEGQHDIVYWIDGAKKEGDVPKTCWYKGVKIVKV